MIKLFCFDCKATFRSFGRLVSHMRKSHPVRVQHERWMHDSPARCNCGQGEGIK